MEKFQPFYKVHSSRTQARAPDLLEFNSAKSETSAGAGSNLSLSAVGGAGWSAGPASIFVSRRALEPFARQFKAAHPGFGQPGQDRFTRQQLVTLLARLDHAATFIEHARSLEDMRAIDVTTLQERPGFHSLKGELGRMLSDLRFFLQTTLRRNHTLRVRQA